MLGDGSLGFHNKNSKNANARYGYIFVSLFKRFISLISGIVLIRNILKQDLKVDPM
jgi:hypothetical protein